MRKPTGILHIVDFKTEQIVSTLQPADYWDDKRHWEIKNNIDTLDFTAFDGTRQAITLMQQNLVLKEVRDGRIVPYVITQTAKDSDNRSITTYASGEWIQIAKSGIIKPQRIESKTVNEFVDMALAGMKWKRGRTEYTGFHTMTIDEFIDPLKFLKDIASLFGLEIQYRVEVVGSQIVGRYVDMVKRRGRVTGKEITLGKDLKGVRRIENSQNICTALVGFVKGEGDKLVTIESINNGYPYITDSDAFQRWNERGQHKFGFYTPETEDQDMSPKRLKTLMEMELKKRINTSISYEVEAEAIGRVFGLAHELVNEGDTVRIKDTGFTPRLYLEARVIAGDESFKDPEQDKYVYGDYHEIVDPNEELRKLYNRILTVLGDKANKDVLEQLEKLAEESKTASETAVKESEHAKKLAEKVQENLKNYQTTIIESANEPTTGLEAGKTLWLDISNGRPGVLKKWNGNSWDPVVPNVESVKKEVQEELNQEISKIQEEINKKVDQDWVNEQVKDKADKSGVFTKDEIREGFVGKKTYETDRDGNIKKFEEISTSFEQTNEAIKSKAEKQSVIDLGNGLSLVSQTANEAKQTAEGNTRTISEVSSQVSNVEKAADEFSKKATKIEETVNGITTTVSNIESTQDTFNQRITNVEQTAEGLSSSVKQLAEVNNEQDKRIKEAESTISQTAEEIKSKVTSKEVEDIIGGLGIMNMLRNTDFSLREGRGHKYWGSLDWTKLSVDGMGYEGSPAVYVNITGETANKSHGSWQDIDCNEGETIVVSAYFLTKNVKSIDQGWTLELKFKKADGTDIKQHSVSPTLADNIWIRAYVSGTAPAGTKIVQFRWYVKQNGSLGMSQPMLQTGSRPSQYLPNPKDVTDYDELLNQLADKISKEGYNQKVRELETAIKQNKEQIELRAVATEVYTTKESDGRYGEKAMVEQHEASLKLQAKEIESKVSAGNIASTINQTAQSVKVKAEKIDLVGQVEASWIKAGLLQGTTVKTSNMKEHIHMENQVLRFVNQGQAKIVVGFEDERQSKTFNPYIILGEGDGTGRNFGSIYKDGNGVYYRYVDANGAESSVRLTAQGNVGITAQTSMWLTSLGNLILDGKTLVAINNNGKTVASFKAANGGGDCDIYLGSHTIRSSTVSGYDQLLQIKNLMGNGFKGIEVAEVTAHGGIRSDTNLWAEKDSYAMQHINRSTAKLKTSVHDLPFSALDKIRGLQVKQYFLKRDMYELYQMRMNRPEDRLEPYTTEDIEVQYGLIAEETDEIFTTREKDGIKLYPTLSILTAGVQELEIKFDEKIKALEEKHDEEIKRVEEKHNTEMNVMNQKIESLEALVQKLINEKTEQ
ncbi:phage tail spike protein [Bacillus sp. JJ1127]|uniref:phage tail spike protein n=1 Tax=Bacillus sp. JJ1127 TaxID=3122952 RepID=UPI0030002A20